LVKQWSWPADWVRGGRGALAPQLPRAIRVGSNQAGKFFGVHFMSLSTFLGVDLLQFLGVHLH